MAGFAEDRVSITALVERIKQKLEGQQPQFVSLIPDVKAAHGGEFSFIGKAPPPPPTRTLVFQTLPGSFATLAGSPLSKSWFDEIPWMTPAMRLLADGDYELVARPFVDGTAEFGASIDDPKRLAESLLRNEAWTPEKSVHDIALKLASLDRSDRSAYARAVDDTLSSIKTRAARLVATDLHLSALLENARLKYRESKPDDEELAKLDDLFKQASEAYADDRNRGLQARCLADHAQWLLVEKRYEEARDKYSRALEAIEGARGTERFQIELHAGTAYASRQWAKRLLTEVSGDYFKAKQIRNAARTYWEDAAAHYAALASIADEIGLPENDPVRAYLHERLAWLKMDLWEINKAEEHFKAAIDLRENATTDLSAFLNYANSKQGVAMASRLSGRCGKDDLTAVQQLIQERIDRSASRQDEVFVLHQRLCNTIERLGDCDYLEGRSRMAMAFASYEEGLEVCEAWDKAKHAVSNSERTLIDEQRLRFLCKAIIATVLSGQDDLRHKQKNKYDSLRKTLTTPPAGVAALMCEFADAFSKYSAVKMSSAGNHTAIQEALDAIRDTVQRYAKASLDRESAELLMMAAGILADEQRRLDAKILRSLLPIDSHGNPPKAMTQHIREQYDRVILLQGQTYAGTVSSSVEFGEFRDLVLNVRQSTWTSKEKGAPFVVFYFPLNGSNGLLILSDGRDDRRIGEIHELGFGWRDIGSIRRSVKEKLDTLTRDNPALKIGWPDDRLLAAEGFETACPFIVKAPQ